MLLELWLMCCPWWKPTWWIYQHDMSTCDRKGISVQRLKNDKDEVWRSIHRFGEEKLSIQRFYEAKSCTHSGWAKKSRVYMCSVKKSHLHTRVWRIKCTHIFRTMVFQIPRVITMVLTYGIESSNRYLTPSMNTIGTSIIMSCGIV